MLRLFVVRALIVLVAVYGVPAEASVSLPVRIYVDTDKQRPIVSDAYLDYIVETSNRWLRPAGVCVYVDEVSTLGRDGVTKRYAKTRSRRKIGAHRRGIPIAVLSKLDKGVTGWGRSGRAPAIALARDKGQVTTLAHELGHVLGLDHSNNKRAVMAAPSPNLTILSLPMTAAERKRVRVKAKRFARRFKRSATGETCMQQRPLTPLSEVHSGHPLLYQSKVTWKNGTTYQGELLFSRAHGVGKQQYAGSDYAGAWRFGKRHGIGTTRWTSGGKFHGHYDNGTRSGYGTYTSASGQRYSGQYEANKRHGHGVLVANGRTYRGQFAQGHRHGAGTMYTAKGVYRGRWQHGKRVGKPRWISATRKRRRRR